MLQVADAVDGWPAGREAGPHDIDNRLLIVEMDHGYLFGRVRFAPVPLSGPPDPLPTPSRNDTQLSVVRNTVIAQNK